MVTVTAKIPVWEFPKSGVPLQTWIVWHFVEGHPYSYVWTSHLRPVPALADELKGCLLGCEASGKDPQKRLKEF